MEEVTSCSFNNPLFQQEEKGGVTYRIPALLYIPPKYTFLAFAEKRSTSRDEDALHLVLRRGLRTGHTVQWGPLTPLMEATIPGHRTMNPCPVWERNTGCVYLFFICVQGHVSERQQILSGRNAARLCCISSRDSGCSWSNVRDLTEEVIGPEAKRWATFAVGPGHGIQLKSGRLIIPAYTYYIPYWFFCFRLPCKARPHSLMIYSDDLGTTWHHGRLIKPMVTVECEVAEVTGRAGHPVLYCSARTPNKCRAEALSTDHGECFQRPALSQQLCEPPHGCQGSVVSFQPLEIPNEYQDPNGKDDPALQQNPLLGSSRPEQEEAGTLTESWLLYSHPTSKKRRVNLGIYVNRTPLDAACWSSPWILHCGPCGYSDLAALEEGLFGCLFECGIRRECEQIAFRLFTDQEILSHVQGECTCPGRNSDPIQN
ncbi:sialidase-3 [Pipistrellus kuhlii]|uniref:exo-alpha-sialidase n=1 Tax=Pipistrellus kuhlii TaxID=59472 RepID=A0A7J7X0P6_PIPKU|nr:sialidase-3 [Pipistrellus kuhlii]XP_045433453.1 sialidase-3 [Pipistrellus kuhlii]KAF6343253.1 neuraminidase 3 [Pipistrellus kuhlii]